MKAVLDTAAVAGALCAERLGLARVRSARDVPGSAEAMTPEWLTAVLCADSPDAHVCGVTVVDGSDGTSSRRALRVTYGGVPGAADGLPEYLFVKFAGGFQQRMLIGLTGITVGEATFFNDLRSRVELRSPTAYFADAEPRSGRSMVIMDDLARDGWTFPDPMNNPITEDDALDMVEQLAAYHSTFWDGACAGTALASLPSPLQFQQRLNSRVPFRWVFDRAIRNSRALMSERLWAQRDSIWPAAMAALSENEKGPQTLLHQDTHPGNWMRDATGRMGLYDWQCVAFGGWALDLSYALCTCLTREDRQQWQWDLLSRYLDLLTRAGVAGIPSFDSARESYRRQALHTMLFGVPANGLPAMLSAVQSQEYIDACLVRGFGAIEDLDSLNIGS